MRSRATFCRLLALSLLANSSLAEPDPTAAEPFPVAVTHSASDAPATSDAPADHAATVESITALLQAGQLDDARAAATAALAQFPDNPAVLHAKGAVERHQGDHLAAVATYEQLLAIAPDDPTAGPVLALLLRELAAQSNGKQAVSHLRRATQLAPDDPPTRVAYCLAAASAKQPADVIAAYEGLDADTQRRPDLLRAAADSYASQENFTRAASLLETLLDAAPSDRSTAEAFVNVAKHLPEAASQNLLAGAALRHPTSMELLRATAQLALTRQDVWTALPMLARLLALDPTDGEAASMQTALLADLGCFTLASALLNAHTDAIDATVADGVRFRAEELQAQWAAIDASVMHSGGPTGLVTLAYGDVAATAAPGQPAAFTMAELIRQLEYLNGHDFRFLSAREVLAARRHRTALPERAVLLLVEGGYASFAERILPLLEQYGCPVVLTVPTALLEGEASEPDGAPRMSWDQIRLAAAHPLVTLASQTHNLGASVPSNPQEHLGLASVTRIYAPPTDSYETAQTYRDRIVLDLKTSRRVIESRTERMTDLLVWPQGAYNGITLKEARELDFSMMFAAGVPTAPNAPDLYATLPAAPGTSLDAFARNIWNWGIPPAPPRTVLKAMPLDLAALATDTPAVTRANLAAAVERAVQLGVSRVYLTACADDNADGAADTAFFPNRVLPVKMDILSHAVELLRQRGLQVHVVMPSLGIQPPNLGPDSRLFVMEYRWGRVTPSGSPQARLSPFNAEACQLIRNLYEDLGAYVDFDGVLFDRDAHLTDAEDAGAAAATVLRDRAGIRERNPALLSPEQYQQRLDMKIAVLDTLLADLQRSIKALRPRAFCARAIAGSVVVDPAARGEFAQDFRTALAQFDGVWVDATPENYTTQAPEAWIQDLASAVAAQPGAREKTVFALGLSASPRGNWLGRSDWANRVRNIVERGGRQIAYYPDEGPGDGLPHAKTVLKIHQIANESARLARDE